MATSRRLLDWMDRNKTPTSDRQSLMMNLIEPILTRRIMSNRLDGYTLETAKEIAVALECGMEERN